MTIIGVDTGGTFTDFIAVENGRMRVAKRLSTPDDPSRAVLDGLAALGGEGARHVVHGSTVATNAILERKGVRAALVANQGFTDVVAIGRQNRSRLYDLAWRRAPALVPAELRFGVPGRIDCRGREIEPFDPAAAREAARRIREAGAASVAVCLLFSFANPAHELAMAEILAQETDAAVSLSHKVLAEFREFERTSTLVVNASVSPIMQRYLSRLEAGLHGDPLSIMQSNGGRISAETAGHEAVRTILSGPAGGVVGALAVGRRAGFDQLVTFDMGGTSTDVCCIQGELPLTTGTELDGYPVKVPMIDIHTVGAGGGSIARFDSGGALAVGPASAGADPGPACYGRGRELTVTDANLFLGRLVPERFLGGEMALDAARTDALMRETAARAGLDPYGLAQGIVDVANANMERALRVISVERGYDPREFALFSFGGAGGLHCVDLARLLRMDTVLVPANPGILSALGMATADVVRDYSLTVMQPAEAVDESKLAERFAPLADQGRSDLASEGFAPEQARCDYSLDMRYKGQSFELNVPLGRDFAGRFEAEHERLYGYRNPGKPIEVVNLRLRVSGRPHKPAAARGAEPDGPDPQAALVDVRRAWFEGRGREVPVYERERLRPGNRVAGPAVLVEYSSTLVLPPGASLTVDGFSNLVVDTGAGRGDGA